MRYSAYNVEITIIEVGKENIDPACNRDIRLKRRFEFGKSTTGYGNDMSMTIEDFIGRILEVIDLRYDKSFKIKTPESYIADYIYNKWSGENSAWDVVELRIKADKRTKLY